MAKKVKQFSAKQRRQSYIWSRIDAYSSISTASSVKLKKELSRRKRYFSMANSEFSTENVRAANPCLLKVNNLNTNVNRYKHLMDEEDFFF